MTYAQFLNEYHKVTKYAFVGNPMETQSDGMLQQIQQMVQTLPPEQQQQVSQQLEQIQQLPGDKKTEALQQIGQQLSQSQQEAQQVNEQAETQAQGSDPKGVPGSDPNGLDQKVQLTVRELLDLQSGGKASQNMLKLELIKDKHNMQKAQQQQKMEEAEAQRQAEQAQQEAMAQDPMAAQAGGLYPQPMGQ